MSTERLGTDEPNPCAPLKPEVCQPAPPALDWGPFSVGMVICLVFVVLTAVAPIVGGWGWWELAWVVTVPMAFLCLFSAVGVLFAKRRIWDSEQRQTYIERHGNLSAD